MSTVLEPASAICRTVPLTDAIELNPKPDRGSLSDDFEVSFVPMAAVEPGTGGMDATRVRRYAEVKKGYTYFREGDVLFAKITPCMENGKMAVARHLRNGVGFGSTEFHVLRPRKGVDAHYVYHFVSSARFRAEAAHRMTGAVGQKRVPAAFLEQSEIPLPPIDEQRRLVAEMEKQFSRLDGAVGNLKRVKTNLKRYKAGVLKAAVEGRLVPTEAELARREGRSYETGAQLLQRVIETRRSQWKGKGKYKEPAAPDTTGLPNLPEGWVWATVGQIGDVQLGKMLDRQKHRSGQELPYLRNINVRWRSINTDDVLTMFFERDELDRFGVYKGDVLVCEGGEPGRAAVWDGRVTGMKYQKAIHRVRLLQGFLPSLLVCILEHLAATGRLEKYFTGSTIKHFTRESLLLLPVPVPPDSEQHRIVAEVDRSLSIGAEVEAQVDSNRERAARFRQTTLQQAFSHGLLAKQPPRRAGKSI